ncbi:TetR/AcrR family transcriptional regulator [Humidisolicoccus flavus]|uniref:TetR/AcrR family transcriptional regulator n=1 Tax=Humidisolicoccus flavus TaxID=3111414 RepID=UPI00324B2C70
MGQTWRATEKANRRAKYLQAAADLFAEHGFGGVSIDDLGEAVGVSGPALYRHFESKEAILVELLVGASERLLDGCERVLAEEPSPSPETALRQLVDFHIDFALTERSIIRLQDRELQRLPENARRTVRRLQQRYVAAWSEILQRLEPGLSPAAIDIRILGTFGLMNSTPFSARTTGRSTAATREAAAVLAGMAIRSLRSSSGDGAGLARSAVD